MNSVASISLLLLVLFCGAVCSQTCWAALAKAGGYYFSTTLHRVCIEQCMQQPPNHSCPQRAAFRLLPRSLCPHAHPFPSALEGSRCITWPQYVAATTVARQRLGLLVKPHVLCSSASSSAACQGWVCAVLRHCGSLLMGHAVDGPFFLLHS